jgi:hypothetical protein
MSNRTRTGTRSECHFSSGLGNHAAAMHLTVMLMQFDLVTCRAPSHHPETLGRDPQADGLDLDLI